MKHLFVGIALMALPFLGASQTVAEINKPTISNLDQVTPFRDGLAAVRKGNQWGFIDKEGQLIIDFRNDMVWNQEARDARGVAGIQYPQFYEGLCIISKPDEEGILRYGFINTEGETVIEPEFMNITPFEDGYAIGIFVRKDMKGQNEFKLNIYEHSFTEVLVNKAGDMVWPIQERQNIKMSKRSFELPELKAKMLTKNLLAVKGKDEQWKLVRLDLKDN